ncbi:hypothetical protein EB118_11385 [bacterium]|nr:hypothetical protein [bacterium]NDD83466.1 hypothetical protein [bacterium]NDG30660.1 hypothetical protein [bacterium]
MSVVVIDYLNVFSDFREIKYKRERLNFHEVKHKNKTVDTYEFFKLFFTRYTREFMFREGTKFYFVMKKLYGYQATLDVILRRYAQFDLTFVVIEQKYTDYIVDKNKDDFVCMYFYNFFRDKGSCYLLSNDKYRDFGMIAPHFKFDIEITLHKHGVATRKCVVKSEGNMRACKQVCRIGMSKQKLTSLIVRGLSRL